VVVIPAVVYWIGLSSLLADISAESVASALPVFLYSILQLSPLQVGFLDGLYQGGAALVRVAAAYVADRRRDNRGVAFLGYALSALSRIGFLFSGSAGLLLAMVSLCMDRVGKGIRTAPRDALIAGHSRPEQLGAAFGVHRAMDAVGAFVGPLLGAAILWWLPFGFDWLFAASLVFGVAGLVVFRAQVTEPRAPATVEADAVNEAVPGPWRLIRADKAFLRLTVLAAFLAMFTISDGLVYLSMQRASGIDERLLPMMFAVTALFFLATAAPIGRLADRVGPFLVFLGGYVLLAGLYLWLAFAGVMGRPSVAAIVCLLGVHYAATDGVLAATATRSLDARVRATGLAVLATAVGLTRIGSSSVYGWVWERAGQSAAIMTYALGMSGCCAIALLVLRARAAPASPVLPA